MASESSATTIWHGSLEEGRGETTTASGTLESVEVIWPARVERTEGTTGPESSHITVKGSVDGIDEAGFEQAAQAAGEGCPISGAFKGNVEITVDATLEG